MKNIIKKFLKSHSDIEKAKFDSKIIKTALPVLGVKTSELDKFAKNLSKEGGSLSDFDFDSHEEVVLAGMMIGYKKCSAKEKISLLEQLFPYFDNWAVVDTIIPRLKGLESEREYFENLLKSKFEFQQRTGIIFLMKFVLPYDLENVVKLLKTVINQYYYVNMAISWCYAEGFIKNFSFMIEFIKCIDDKFVRNKSILKACESFRLTSQQKAILRELKI